MCGMFSYRLRKESRSSRVLSCLPLPCTSLLCTLLIWDRKSLTRLAAACFSLIQPLPNPELGKPGCKLAG